MSIKELLLEQVEKQRLSLLAQLARIPAELSLAKALPDAMDQLCVHNSVRISVGKDWLCEAALSCTVPAIEDLLQLFELLTPEPMALYQSSTFCFAPVECEHEVTKGDSHYKTTPVKPITFRANGLNDEFTWWTRLDGHLTRVTVRMEKRQTTLYKSASNPVEQSATWAIGRLPGGTLILAGSPTFNSAGDIVVHWPMDADLATELAKTQSVTRRTF